MPELLLVQEPRDMAQHFQRHSIIGPKDAATTATTWEDLLYALFAGGWTFPELTCSQIQQVWNHPNGNGNNIQKPPNGTSSYWPSIIHASTHSAHNLLWLL